MNEPAGNPCMQGQHFPQFCRTTTAQLNARVSELVAAEIAARSEAHVAQQQVEGLQQQHRQELGTLQSAQSALHSTLHNLQPQSEGQADQAEQQHTGGRASNVAKEHVDTGERCCA
jgi:hypothetical protein